MKSLFEWLFNKCKVLRYTPLVVEDLPDKLRKRKIYILKNEDFAWQMNMLCPCGCQVILYINLLQEIKPCWKYQIDNKNLLTLKPSIHRFEGCKSHFFITKGSIVWV